MQDLARSLIAAVVALAFVAPAQGAERPDKWWETSKLPLYDAFIAFCVETNAELDAVKAAVEAAGGKQGRARFLDPNGPIDTIATSESWDVVVGGHKVSVSAAFYRARTPRPNDARDCTIKFWAKDDDSISEIEKWVGIPVSSGGKKLRFYHWHERGRSHEPFDQHRHESEGSWMLAVILFYRDSPALQLTHFLPVQPSAGGPAD